MYGKGAYSLSKDIGVTVKEADAFLKNYLAAFPKRERLHGQDHRRRHGRDGYVSTLFGRRRALPELASSNRQRAGQRRADGHATPPFRALLPTSSSWPWCGCGSGCGTKKWKAA